VPLEVEVETTCRRCICDTHLVLAIHAHGEDHVGVCEEELHLVQRLLGLAVRPSSKFIASNAGTLITAICILTLLVARVDVPFFALVPIYARARIVGHLLADWAIAGATLKGRPARELAAKRGTQRIRAGVLLISAILTIPFPITELALVYALRCSPIPTLWTVELIIRARNGRTVLLVRTIRAVLVSVAAPPRRDAQSVVAPELARVAWREIAVFLIRSVRTLGPVVALLILLNAFLSVLASELGQLARHPLAALFVRLISTVEVAVALFLLRDEQTVLPPLNFALVVLVVLLPIVAVLFVAFVVAVNFLVTPIVWWDAVGRVPLVRTTRELPRLTIGRRAIRVFIFPIFTVLVVVAHPSLGNTLAVGPARKLVGCAQLWLTIVASFFGRRQCGRRQPIIWRNGTAWSTVAPLALSSHVVAGFVNES